MEKLSSFDRVQGYPHEQHLEGILGDLSKKGGEQLAGEVEKTEQEIEIIKLMNNVSNRIRRRYGLKNFEVLTDNIHIMGNLGNYEEYSKIEEDTLSLFSATKQAVITRAGQHRLAFAEGILHELIHFKSHGAMDVVFEDDRLVAIDFDYRGGFGMTDKKSGKKCFEVIDEALTQEETKREIENLKQSDPRIAQYTDETMNLSDKWQNERWDEASPVAEDLLFAKSDQNEITLERYKYPEERLVLKLLINKLLESNRDRFKSPEEIYDLFMRAKMTGKLLPIARVIEKTFGEGSFRRLGEYSTDRTRELKNLIEQGRL